MEGSPIEFGVGHETVFSRAPDICAVIGAVIGARWMALRSAGGWQAQCLPCNSPLSSPVCGA